MEKINPYIYAGINPLALKDKTEVIIKLIMRETGVTLDALKGSYRGRDVVDARALGMYFMRKYTNLSLYWIGDYFNKHHATVLHAMRKIEDLKQIDSRIASMVEQIEYDLKNARENIGTCLDFSRRDELIGFYYN